MNIIETEQLVSNSQTCIDVTVRKEDENWKELFVLTMIETF